MGYDLDYLGDEGLVWCDLVVPRLHKVSQDDCHYRIELYIDIAPARQGRQELFDRSKRRPVSVVDLLGAEHAADQL